MSPSPPGELKTLSQTWQLTASQSGVGYHLNASSTESDSFLPIIAAVTGCFVPLGLWKSRASSALARCMRPTARRPPSNAGGILYGQ